MRGSHVERPSPDVELPSSDFKPFKTMKEEDMKSEIIITPKL